MKDPSRQTISEEEMIIEATTFREGHASGCIEGNFRTCM